MCSKVYSLVSKMQYKVLLVSLFLLLVALSSLVAWPIKQDKEVKLNQAESVQALVQEKVAEAVITRSVPTLSENSQMESMSNKQNLEIELNKRVLALENKLNSSTFIKDDFKEDIAYIKSSFEAYNTLEKTEDVLLEQAVSALEKVEAQNIEQADNIVKLTERLDKEKGTKAIVKLNGILGFKNHLPQFGAGASIGVRFGKGFLVEAGANYMLGTDFMSVLNFDLDNLQVITSVGWEF